MANGAWCQLADALTNVAYTTGAVTREIFPAGSTGSFGITPASSRASSATTTTHVSWTAHQRPDSVAQNFMARFEENENVTMAGYRPAAEAALWAGYANRLLGDAFCEAVIDGGPIGPAHGVLGGPRTWFTRTMALAGQRARDVA
jgi:starch-binding outer membrane protein, SusD/RagB family